MDPVERELRKKLRGLRTSQSRTSLALESPGTKDRAKQYQAKLKELKTAIKEVEQQIESHLKNSPALPVLKKPVEGRTVAVVGDVYRFLATGEDTNGKYAMWENRITANEGGDREVAEDCAELRHRDQAAGVKMMAGNSDLDPELVRTTGLVVLRYPWSLRRTQAEEKIARHQ